MPRRWQIAKIGEVLRRNWRVRPHCYRPEEHVGQLVVRPLEERRVLTISPAVALALAAVNGETDIAEAVVTNPDPATPLGTDAAHQEPVDPGNRPVQGEQANVVEEPGDTDGPAAENLNESDNASTVDPQSVEAQVAANLQGEAVPLNITAASDPPPVAEGSLLSITNIGVFSESTLNETEYQYTIDWGDGLADSGVATIDVPGGDGQPTEGSFDGAHTYADNGVYTVTVTVTGEFGSASDTLRVIVNNVTPTLTVPGTQVIDEGALLSIENIGQVSDPGFDNPLNPGGEVSEEFTFAIDWGDGTDLDTGPVSIDQVGSPGMPTKGSFDGSHIYADNGVYTVTVFVSDDDGGTVNKSFTVIVNNVTPTLVVPPDQVIDEGALLSLTNIGQITDPAFDNPLNPAGEVSEEFTFAIDWGDGTDLDTGPVTIDTPGGPEVATAGSFDGSHIYADNGVYTVTVTVSDDDGGTVSETFTVIVNNVAPTLVVPPDQVVDEGALLSITNIGQFTDPAFDNPNNPAGEVSEEFTFAIDWGDGTDLDTGPVTIDTPGGPEVATAGSFDGSHIYADNGVYTVTVTVSDDDGGTVSKTFTVTVNNVAPNLIVAPDEIVNEGSLLSVTNIGQFTDPGFDNPLNEGGETTETFTFSIDWGDGTPLDMGAATIDVPGGPGVPTAGSFDGSHIYADNGVYTVTITVMDDDGGVASDTLTVIVNNVAPTLVVPGDQMVDAGSLLSLPNIGQFTDPGFDNPLNPAGEISEEFTFAIDWGDGTPLDTGPGIIDVFGSAGVLTQGSFDGSHVYLSDGVFTVTVTVSDDDGGTTSDTFQVIVKSAAPILITAPDQTINEGSLLSVSDIAQFIDPRAGGAEGYTYTIQWGDGLPNSSGAATIDSQGEGPTTGSFDGAHIYADNGLYTVTLTLTTSDGRFASETLLVTVHNVAPTLVVPGNQSLALGSTLSIADIGKFTDPGFDNPLNAEGETTERFTFAVNWGDALFVSSGPGTIDTPGMNNLLTAGSFDAAHIFGAPGTFTVTVTVSDDDGGSASGQFTVIVFVIRDSPPSLFIPPGGGGGPATQPLGFADPGVPPGPQPGITRFEFRRVGAGSVAGAEPRLVLRIVTPAGIEDKDHDEPLADEVLDNLRKLFRRLPDGHYRIYQIQPDGIERLVVDVIVRQGRNIDVADELQGTGETTPQPNAAPQADAAPKVDEAKHTAPQGAPPEDGAEHDRTMDDSSGVSTAAIALGGGIAGYAAPLGRRRWGRSARQPGKLPLSKVGRLLRRLR